MARGSALASWPLPSPGKRITLLASSLLLADLEEIIRAMSGTLMTGAIGRGQRTFKGDGL